MECSCCNFVRFQFVCCSCNRRGVVNRRSRLAILSKERERYEDNVARVLEEEEELSTRAQRSRERDQRVDLLRAQIDKQTQLLQQERDLLTERRRRNRQRQLVLDQAKRLFAAQVEAQRQPISGVRLSELRDMFVQQSNKRVEELLSLYVIRRKDAEHCSIVALPLPDNVDSWFNAATALNPEVMSSGLGYIVFLLLSMARYLCMWLPFPLVFCGSTSTITFLDRYGNQQTLVLADDDPSIRRAISLLDANVKSLCVQNGVSPGSLGSRCLCLMPDMLSLIQAIGLRLRARDIQNSPRSDALLEDGQHSPRERVGSDTDSEEWDLLDEFGEEAGE